jgi:3-hydroxybutyryl-CoA dehydrogenase
LLKEAAEYKQTPVLIIGSEQLACSVSVCLSQAGHQLTLFTENSYKVLKSITTHFADLSNFKTEAPTPNKINLINKLDSKLSFKLVIVLTDENLLKKKALITQLEKKLPADSIIAVNTESIPLSILQRGCNFPERIIGVNWVEPAHTTYFLEIITNNITNSLPVKNLFHLAKEYWNKDPYIISNDLSIRAKMFAAMAREAFYLVQNGYASIEDIDRACRNDAGYYLPFAGNYRYMDLMGPYAYGLVMKDLNCELSKDQSLPGFLKNIIANGGSGMENNKGFYNYEKGDAEKWHEKFRKFSFQISRIIDKYPFNYGKENALPAKKAKSVSP